LIAISLDEEKDEKLISVKLTTGHKEILLATRNGMSIRFSEEDVRDMGRTAHGVRGISLSFGDSVVAMDTIEDPLCEVLTVTESGYGKRSDASLYTTQTRGGKGKINYNVTEKTGAVVGMSIVKPSEELYVITGAGIIIRVDVEEIRQIGRNTSGVKIVDLNKEAGDKVTSICSVEPEETVLARRQEIAKEEEIDK